MIIKVILILVIIIFVGYQLLIVRTKLIERSHSKKKMAEIEIAAEMLDTNPNLAISRINNLAEKAEFRILLYDALKLKGKSTLFPKEFFNQEAFAESNLAFWLCHPNELQKAPDEIQLMAKVKRSLVDENREAEFYVFRFRVNEPHWAAHIGWMVGITGPYIPGEEIKSESSCTFSELESYESRAPEDHVDYLIPKLNSVLTASTKF